MTRETRILSGRYTPSPKLSVDGQTIAVAVATKEGVELVLLTDADLKEKEPDVPKPDPPTQPELPIETRVERVDVTVDGSTLRAEATVSGKWDWILWTVAPEGPASGHVVKLDDLTTTVENLRPGPHVVIAQALLEVGEYAETATTIAQPVEPPKPGLTPIRIGVTIPSPGSAGEWMADRARLKVLQQLGLVGCRYNWHYLRSKQSFRDQYYLYAEYWHGRDHAPIIDWSEIGTAPDPNVDPNAVIDFALWVADEFPELRFAELGNEMWQKKTPTAEYLRVARPVAQALHDHTNLLIGICADYADYGIGRHWMNVDLQQLLALIATSPRYVPCVHPYTNPATNRIAMAEIKAAFAKSPTIYASEWGVKSNDPEGLIAGLDALRAAHVPVVYLYAYDDGAPDYMGLIKGDGSNEPTATGVALQAYLSEMNGPVEPPEPDPPHVTVPAAKDMAGDFLNGFGDFAVNPHDALFLLPYFDHFVRRNRLSVYRDHGYTHVPFAPWGEYSGRGFDYRTNPAGLIEVIEDCHAEGCKPMLFVFADNFGAHRWSMDRCLSHIRDYLPQVVPALGDDPYLVLSWEGEQSLDVLDRTKSNDTDPWARWVRLIEAIRKVCPRGELGIHLPPNEWSPLVRHTGTGDYRDFAGQRHKDPSTGAWLQKINKDPNAILVRMRKAGATALLMQWPPDESDEKVVNEGHVDASGNPSRPDGGIAARVVRAGLRFYHFECRRTSKAAISLAEKIKALNNPHVSGGNSGWRV